MATKPSAGADLFWLGILFCCVTLSGFLYQVQRCLSDSFYGKVTALEAQRVAVWVMFQRFSCSLRK